VAEKRPKEVFSQSYVRPGLKLLPEYLPKWEHIDPSCRVDEAFVTKAGRMSDGREFQDIRVYLLVKVPDA
jgi:hypothetical protein